MTQLNRDPYNDPHTLTKDLATQNKTYDVYGVQPSRSPYGAGIMNQQQLNQQGQALYNYCKLKRSHKFVPVAIVVTVLMWLLITLLVATVTPLLTAVFIGGIMGGLFGFLCWYVNKQQTGTATRLDYYLAADGGQGLFSDFASAQPFEDDQFRLGRQYLFIKNSTVLRLDSIYDIVRINTSAGIYLTVKAKDEHGSIAYPLCRVHLLSASEEFDEIRKAVLQGRF